MHADFWVQTLLFEALGGPGLPAEQGGELLPSQ